MKNTLMTMLEFVGLLSDSTHENIHIFYDQLNIGRPDEGESLEFSKYMLVDTYAEFLSQKPELKHFFVVSNGVIVKEPIDYGENRGEFEAFEEATKELIAEAKIEDGPNVKQRIAGGYMNCSIENHVVFNDIVLFKICRYTDNVTSVFKTIEDVIRAIK